MIEFRHLQKAYPNAIPLKDVNAVINPGDIISVIGPSGCGKSTLLRCLNMLDKPTGGEIIVDGQNITAKGVKLNEVRKKMGMVFQQFNLFGHLTVIENVMKAPVDLLGVSRQDAYDKAMELLRMVGMDGKALTYPDQLSGGQTQRVAIARTLAMDPEIILFDEPTSALDPTMIGEVEVVIRELSKMGKTMMIVTHEMRFAREICNRVFYMDQGVIYEDGPPEQIFDNPQKERTRRFIRHLKVLEIMIDSRDYDFIGTVSRIDQYGYKNRIAAKTVYRIQSLFEELCQQVLLPRLTAPRISFVAEYDENAAAATLTVQYNGEPFDPRDTNKDDVLPMFLVENLVENMEYSYCGNEELGNRLVMRVR